MSRPKHKHYGAVNSGSAFQESAPLAPTVSELDVMKRARRNSDIDEWKSTTSEDNRPSFMGPRLLSNNTGYGWQDWNISRRGKNKGRFWRDPFHTLAYTNTGVVVVLVFMIYVLSWTVFALIYWWTRCDWIEEEHKDFYDAFLFSVETGMTIGYGSGSAQGFHNCRPAVWLIGSQAYFSVLVNALCVGLLAIRLARPHARAETIVFSQQATVEVLNGVPHLNFRITDMRDQQLIEAHVRCYTIRRIRGGGAVSFESYRMRLLRPNDELGAMLLLAVPSLVTHAIDVNSPLSPDFDPLIRGPKEQLLSCTPAQIQVFMDKSDLEVIVVVEGVDAATSSAVQARHSYKGDEIVWNYVFAPCLTESSNGEACLDFSSFHDIVPAHQREGASRSGFGVPSSSYQLHTPEPEGISYLDGGTYPEDEDTNGIL